jgi:hypothetical protein
MGVNGTKNESERERPSGVFREKGGEKEGGRRDRARERERESPKWDLNAGRERGREREWALGSLWQQLCGF